MTIGPIETKYRGYRFRSRLEARWAVFFDALDIDWEYEREGYDLGRAGWYLPDFFCRNTKWFAEIKPRGNIRPADQLKIDTFTDQPPPYAMGVLLLTGIPERPEWRYAPLTINGITKNIPLPENNSAEAAMFLHGPPIPEDAMILYAVQAARSARFEHGESGYKPRKAWPGLDWGETRYGELPY